MNDETNPAVIPQEPAPHAPPTAASEEDAANLYEDEFEDAEEGIEDDAEGDDDEGEGGDEEDQQEGEEDSDPDLVEVSHNGKSYKVHKDLQRAVMLDADYTQKSQANAETKRELDQRRQQIDQMMQVGEQEIQARGQLHAIDQAIAQLHNTDWNRLETEDPAEAMSQSRQLQQLQYGRQQLAQQIEGMYNYRTQEAARDYATRQEATENYARQTIPGWNAQKAQELTQFCMNDLGVSQQQMQSLMSPTFLRMVHYAKLGSESEKRQVSAKPQRKVQKVTPLKKVTGKSGPSASKSLAEMDMDEYAATMNRRESAQKAKGSR